MLMAVGMDEKQVCKSVLIEGVFQGILSIIFGVLLGLATSYYDYRMSIVLEPVYYEWEAPWLSMVVISVIGMLACILTRIPPIKKVIKMDIVEAIAAMD